ncbi:type 1 glutamine amidotransferase family protein [Longirhabdus pacifica]|uniref:type 1 glutamine amidotransferase family protein n=1 Tax=Longirhabdus pacifica TaxID=2305227 RepID=UPI00100936BC|nr:type 1 glutamine amidotransferase family protein [Longirhabdus pacifica]
MQTNRAYLYVCNTMSDWEYGYLIAELHSGRYFKKELSPMSVTTVGVSTETITTMGGLKMKPDVTIDEVTLEENDLIILPGGDTWREAMHMPLLQNMNKALEKGAIVAAICGATEGLANVGMLDSRKHTSNDAAYLKMVCPHYKGEALYENKPAVAHKNLITASGIAPLEFAYEVLNILDVFESDVLNAWYNLNKTQKTTYFFELMDAVQR